MHVFRPTHCRPAAFDLFRAQADQVESPQALLKAAIAVAMHEMIEVDPDQVLQSVDRLAFDVRSRVRSQNPHAVLAHLHDVLFEEHGFTGNVDDYYDPHNSYLPSVLHEKRGIPITLVLLYKAVGERIGLRVHGLNAPGHFMAGVEIAGQPLMIVDPFFCGRVLTRDEAYDRIEQVVGHPINREQNLLQIAGHRHWLMRLLQNLQNIFTSRQQPRELAAMLELRSLL
jgi:regulator of sirC expression with transglutaminase-like and TPR domain